ncbi:uncharacterized protein LOC134649082 [Cydia amplana]|uniref:uncharacterized protein LOC134649082 n=1 Tax=Cydia amplana TaxID=1869771 RepID=UPI002FE580B3
MHQNVNGLINKANVLTVHLQDLSSSNRPIDVLCITEHNMSQGDENQLALSNYALASHFSRGNRNGGSCILVRNIHKYKTLSDISHTISLCNIFECSAIELTEHNIIIICIYRVPKYDIAAFNIFFNKLNDLLCKLNHSRKNVILCGDFNIDMMKRTKQSIEFNNLISSFNLKFGISTPTRLQSNTCIDNIIHNIRGGKSDVIDLAISDHTAQVLKCPVKPTCTLSHWFVLKRDFSYCNIQKFTNCITELSFNDVYKSNDPNEAFNCFSNQFELFYNLCFPFIRLKVSALNRPKWVTKGIRKCCKRKRAMLWKWRLAPTHSNKSDLKMYSQRLKKIISSTQKIQNDLTFMKPSTPDDIRLIINFLKNSKSTGYDGINTMIIKQVANIISSPVSHIVNLCIEYGRFPDKLKVAILRPLYKKGEKTSITNYRPIALLSVFSKVIEKFIQNNINNYFETNNLFSQEQKGFRKQKSINMAIYDLLNIIMTNIDNKVPVTALYMDMTKAFDFVDHKILLTKLYRYGIRGNVFSLIESYLTGRK